MNHLPLTPAQLDQQSPVQIHKWLDIESEECKMKDPDIALTKKWMKMGLEEPQFLFPDSMGRLWGLGNNGAYYPYHFNIGPKNYGFRMSRVAVN